MVAMLTTQNGLGTTTQQDGLAFSGTPKLTYTPPNVVGCWCWFDNAAGGTVWRLTNSGLGDASQLVVTGGTFQFNGTDSTGPTPWSINAGTQVTSQWAFVLCRMVGTSQYIDVVNMGNGQISHNSSVTGLTFGAAPDTFTIGSPSGGSNATRSMHVAEFWYTDADIQFNNAQISDTLLWQLAFYGPFSVPHIIQNIIEYRSFRTQPFGQSLSKDIYFRSTTGMTTWVNGAGTASNPTTGLTPNLPSTYVRPRQFRTIEVI